MSDAAERHLRRAAGDLDLGRDHHGNTVWLTREDLAVHAHIIGSPNLGKTRAMQLIAEWLIDAGDCSVVVLDPHDGSPPRGGLFHALKVHCYDHGHDERLITVDPGEIVQHGLVTGFNPLQRGHSMSVRAALAAEHLRTVAQPDEGSGTQWMLLQWGFNAFLGLLAADLTAADARYVMNPQDPAYREAFAEILKPEYPDVAGEWSDLLRREQKRPEDVEWQIGSTRRRFNQYLRNEYLRYTLSTHRFAFDPAQVMRDRKIVLANLNPRGFMDTVQQRMLGTQFVHAFCRAAIDRFGNDNTPCYLVIDEFQNFLTPEVLEILYGMRKFGLHLVLAHQSLQQLQNAALQDWRYYHAVLACCHTRLAFGGILSDAKAIAEETFTLDPYKVKQEIYSTKQLSHLEMMDLRSESGSHIEQSGWTSGRDESHTRSSDPQGQDLSSAFSEAYREALSGSTTDGSSWTSQTVPVIVPGDPFQELSSREFESLEEQLYQYAIQIKTLPRQHAMLHVREREAVFFRVDDVPDPTTNTDEVVGDDLERLQRSPFVGTIAQIGEETRDRDRALRERLSLPPAAAMIDGGAIPLSQPLGSQEDLLQKLGRSDAVSAKKPSRAKRARKRPGP